MSRMSAYINQQGFTAGDAGCVCGGDPSCVYCGYLCSECLVAQGYVKHLECQLNDVEERLKRAQDRLGRLSRYTRDLEALLWHKRNNSDRPELSN